MRTTSLSLLTILCLMLAVAPARAGVYSNGPINGTTDAWTINSGFSVSDSFPVSEDFNGVSGLQIGVWLFPGDSVSSVQVDLGSSPFGTNVFSGVVAATVHTDLGINQFGYDIQQIDFGFQAFFSEPPGTYWLTLSNAVAPSGDPIYWDENSGPSLAYENSLGSIPSESFTLDICVGCVCGVRGPDCGPPVPEPSNILLFGSGILALVGILRRKLDR
jgi:PEP-CTERM motif